ncbi:DUF2937 family protein [Pelagibacterium xiamenense]|uniref:DUF2937 family protein n=1 Tax=Pelagibacterium xiamenense TaxID=2901140 RepID=UPI001E654B58|nr:DUF2937 family protein [Pelagibacterium xiamenense]MCD7058588.1 DUF2937 family protein [Pelagibacterium xiamenense]
MIKRTLCLAGALFGALTFSQVPEYTQYYTQRLGGAIDELEAVIARFDGDAAASGLTREEGFARYDASADPFLNDRGTSIRRVFARYDELTTQLRELRTADPIEKTMSLARYFDSDVGAAALEDFTPAIPASIEGLGFAVAGLVAGYALTWGGTTAASAPFRRKIRRPRVDARR